MKRERNPDDTRFQVMDAILKEQKRAYNHLRISHLENPYFISHRVKTVDYTSIWGSYGAIFNNTRERRRHIYAEVRVGGYDCDQTIDGRISRDVIEKSESFKFSSAPIEDDVPALRVALWRLTDLKYKESLTQYLEKQGRMVNEVIKKKKIPDFTHEKKVIHFDPPFSYTVDQAYWADLIKKLSDSFKRYKKFTNTWIWFQVKNETKFHANTENSQIITENQYYELNIHGESLARDGMPLSISRNFCFRSLEEVMAFDRFEEEREGLAKDLLDLMNSDILEPYTGPALLEPQAAGIFFHEAIGHRLEGERQISNDEGQTFSEKMGEKILPEYLTVIDDPTMKQFDGPSLMGHYLYDDQGVPARRVVLVKAGILQNYLLSRTPVEGFTSSNGHGRNGDYEYPMARMANFIVSTSNAKKKKVLKDMLIKESIKQEKPYGLIIRDVESGETNTSRYSFQAFKCAPKMVYKVDLNTGKESLVRGVEFVGTPLSSISKIMASGDNYKVHNGFCGAESGHIPISTIAPAILVEEMELQRSMGRNKKPPILPFPL